VLLKVGAANGQLSVIEGLYSSLLEELQSAAAAVGKQTDHLVALQEQNERLRAQLISSRAGVLPDERSSTAAAHAHDLL
jgi:hypothetical protein